MLENLIDRFQKVRRKILGYGRITKTELEAILKEIRIVLLEADVNYRIVKEFIEELRTKCESLELVRSLKPGDAVVKAVYEELTLLLGESSRTITFKKNGPLVIILIGLQGVGKTTTAVKLAFRFKSKKPLLVPADVKRPAAYEQLASLAKRVEIPVFPLNKESAVATVKQAKAAALDRGYGIVIIDTAGRLHINNELIDELREIDKVVKPDYRLLVADGMSGQDAVTQAMTFKKEVGLEGAVLTKMDGDARGGAALSITRAADVPIFFIGVGETLEGLEVFYPDRMAQRIMGMGDLVSLVEKVKVIEKEIDGKQMRKKLVKGELNFEDFLEQLKAVKKLGPLSKLAAMIPGVKESDVNEDEMKKIEAIINSMTKKERLKPDIINGSRKRRIAAGSGTTMQDVNQLLKQFKLARDMLKKMGRGGPPGRLPFRI
ncbi:MAG TPA: signal recognition particle protein [candidate division WOR-3 bacterium]|uniref:Signal recognition particle protein n=1 Tax=candidate division WOR-3 bacterium TaxID=2052148 RepID=A0A9C9EMD1_UNCW3|nr:signal recognition particle protein [candidate division WOR-3 bacterium]